MKVVDWDKDFNEFKINEPRHWEAPFHDKYDDKRSRELFFLNLRHAGVNIDPILQKLKEMGF